VITDGVFLCGLIALALLGLDVQQLQLHLDLILAVFQLLLVQSVKIYIA
jgi:hypothetical protein